MEYRLGVLEKHFEKLDGKIDKLLDQAAATNVRLAAIDVKLDAKAAVTDISRIETRLASIDAKLDAKAAQNDLSFVLARSRSLSTNGSGLKPASGCSSL